MKLEMKSCTIEELYEQLKIQEKLKQDIVVPSSSLKMDFSKIFVDNFGPLHNVLDGLGVSSSSNLSIDPNGVFLNQIADKLGITRTYQKRMLEKIPNLFDYNVNQWFKYEAEQKKPRNFLLRTFKNLEGGSSIGRAFLSNSFKIIDNFQILGVALEGIKEESEKSGVKIEVDTCSLTEERMYVRFVMKQHNTNAKILGNYRDPKTGFKDPNGLVSGFILSNSEVGLGKLFTAPRIIVGSCNNGYIWYDEKFQKTHLGAKLDLGSIEWSQDTKLKNSSLILSQIKGVIRKYVSPEFLGQKAEELEYKGSYLMQKPFETVVSICKELGISDDNSDVLNFFTTQGQSQTSFDAMQAVTYYAQHNCDADKRFKLECKAVEMLGRVKAIDRKNASLEN